MARSRSTLFPEIEVFRSEMVEVSPFHSLYVEQCGNPVGIPIMFLHGGPGANIEPLDRRWFNPKKWQVILFDQRGCGKSQPYMETRENESSNLVSDISVILDHLGVEKTALFGGSWGSTLALLYAIAHPERVTGMILRGIFLATQKENDYYLKGGVRFFFPEAWERFVELVPDNQKPDPGPYYLNQILSGIPKVRALYAYEWCRYEMAILRMKQQPEEEIEKEIRGCGFEAWALMEAHYLTQNAFLPPDYIIGNASKLNRIPMTIIQGRFDTVCPPQAAYRLSQATNVPVKWTQAGHSCREPENQKLLIRETEAMYDKVSQSIS